MTKIGEICTLVRLQKRTKTILYSLLLCPHNKNIFTKILSKDPILVSGHYCLILFFTHRLSYPLRHYKELYVCGLVQAFKFPLFLFTVKRSFSCESVSS